MRSAHKILLFGALAGVTALAIERQLRLDRHRLLGSQPEGGGRSSIDDIPTLQASPDEQQTRRFDEGIAPAAPF